MILILWICGRFCRGIGFFSFSYRWLSSPLMLITNKYSESETFGPSQYWNPHISRLHLTTTNVVAMHYEEGYLPAKSIIAPCSSWCIPYFLNTSPLLYLTMVVRKNMWMPLAKVIYSLFSEELSGWTSPNKVIPQPTWNMYIIDLVLKSSQDHVETKLRVPCAMVDN